MDDREAWRTNKNNSQQLREKLSEKAKYCIIPDPLHDALSQAADWLSSVEGQDSEDDDKVSHAWAILNDLINPTE